MKPDTGSHPANPAAPDDRALDDAGRREALEKLATWTPPLLLTLMLSERASAFSPPPPGPPGGF